MKNLPIIILVIVIVFGLGYYFTSQKTTPTSNTVDIATTPTAALAINKTFDIKGLNYTYDVKEVKVKLNDVVKINFTNTEGFHDLKIDEFNIATKQIASGASESIQFIADKVGSFQYYCSVGQHRANGMWGTIVVE